MKRLFITTGSISLINALTIVRQTNCALAEDTLVVLSFFQSDEFIETTKKIASLHNFREILFFKKEKEIIQKINFKNYDILYSATAQKLYPKINRHKNAHIFDEGPGGVRTRLKKFKNIKSVYTTNFLNKLSFIDLDENTKTIELEREIFNEISKKTINLFLEKENLQTQKNALFIGHYVYRALGDNKAIEFYKKYLDFLFEKGYNVYFKAHPRDNDSILPILAENYKNEPKFHCLKNSLPIEIYNYDFDLIAGAYSGTLVSCAHYKNIPCVHLPFKELYKTNLGLIFKQFFALYDEYIPTLAEFEDIIGNDKKTLQKRYWQIISSKKELKNNEKLKKILLYNPNKLKDVFFGFLALFCKNKNLKNKLKEKGRSDFYKMLEN